MPGPIIVSLPIADRPRAFRFYRELGFDAVGTPVEDGVPEPCLFALNPGLQLMLIPSGGFGWVTEGHEVAPPGTSECLLSFAVDGNEHVAAFVERARQAGALVTVEPTEKPWGYVGTFADLDGHLWMVTAGDREGA